jgi:outer membrane protein assembly factor BamB
MKKTWRWVVLIAILLILLALAVYQCQHPKEPIIHGTFPLKERWHFDVGSHIVAEPSVGEGLVLIRTREKLYVLDAHSGSLLWTAPLPQDTSPTSPLIADDLVVIGYLNGVKALNAETGQVMWESSDPSCLAADVVPAALDERMVYIVRQSCDVRAYNRLTGAVVWAVDLPGVRSSANLFLDQDRIYVVVIGDILQILDSETGVLIEEVTGQIGYPAAYQSAILYGFRERSGFKEDHELVALDSRTRETLWVGPVVDIAYPIGPPLVAGQRLLVPAHSGYPMAVDVRTGKPLWVAKTKRATYQTPAILADTVYIRGIRSGKVYALSMQDGTELGYLSTGERFVITGSADTWRPVTEEGVLIVPLGRRVYAYGG